MTTNTNRPISGVLPTAEEISVDRERVKQIGERKNTAKNNRGVALKQFNELAELARKHLPATTLSCLGVLMGVFVMQTLDLPDTRKASPNETSAQLETIQ